MSDTHQRRIQDSQIEGAQKHYAHASHITSAKREVPYNNIMAKIQEPPMDNRSSMVLGARLCYLSFILKHSNTKLGKKKHI